MIKQFFLFALAMVFSASLAGAAGLPNSITGRDGEEMMLIPAGTFTMGSPDYVEGKFGFKPHKVYTDAFYMDKYEVTNGQFARFLNHLAATGHKKDIWDFVVTRSDLQTAGRKDWWPTEIILEGGNYKPFPSFERYPVISVSWFAAYDYCKWAGERLPTEAEWEKAARGGLEGKIYPWGNEIPTGGVIFSRSWTDNSVPAPVEQVGNYFPNGYGLYDMAGNVWEFCSDWYDENYYEHSPQNNPKGPEKGQLKVARGGSWYNSALFLRVDYRNTADPYATDDAVGFRCAKDAGENK